MILMLLVMGNYNYSSWSIRGWLVMKASGMPFEVERVALFTDGFKEQILEHSAAGTVPILVDGDVTVPDSLAIAEYIAERTTGLWPGDAKARAHARAISAEMHSGFMALRANMPMNARATGRSVPVTNDIQQDIDRFEAIVADCRSRFSKHGEWLFGDYSIADMMYAPVVSRLHTYGVTPVSISEYCQHVLDAPVVREWYELSAAEAEVIEVSDIGK